MAALATEGTTSGDPATDAQATTSTKSAQRTGSGRPAKSTGTNTGTNNVAHTTASATAESGAQPAPFVVIAVPAPVQPNSTIAEAGMDGDSAPSAAAFHSGLHSTDESVVQGLTTSSSTNKSERANAALVMADGKVAVQAASSSVGSATEDSEVAGQAAAALEKVGATAHKESAEDTAQDSGLKEVVAAVAFTGPQASLAGEKSNTRAAEQSSQTANGQTQKSAAGIAAADIGSGLQDAATAESARNAALSGQFAASEAKTLEHRSGSATQSNASQSNASQSDATQSSARKRNAHENANAQQAATASSGARDTQTSVGAAKAENLREASSDAATGSAASTAVTAKVEASSAEPVTAMAAAAMPATSGSGTMSARPVATASAETQAATVAASQSSTLDSAHLRTTAGSVELKVSVQLPELGRVEVRAVTSASGTEAHLTTEHHAAAAALSSGRDGLEAALRTHDVTLGSLTTQSEAQGGHGHSQPEAQRASATNNKARDTDGRQTNSEAVSEGIPLPEYSSISVLV